MVSPGIGLELVAKGQETQQCILQEDSIYF